MKFKNVILINLIFAVILTLFSLNQITKADPLETNRSELINKKNLPQKLKKTIFYIRFITPYQYSEDANRLAKLKRATEKSIQKLQKPDIENSEIQSILENLYAKYFLIRYKDYDDFFDIVGTPRTSDKIDKIIKNYESLEKFVSF